MKRCLLLLAVSVALIISSLLIVYVNGEVDKTSTVTRIVDGDTFDISTGERIRLADVDAPEYYENGYSQAKDYLAGMIYGKSVYLDIDDIYTYDYSGTGDRLVCVVYVDYDSTHLMNVNKALLDGGYAEVSDYYNEFNPFIWSLYIPKDGNSESSPTPESGSDSMEENPSTVEVIIALAIILVCVFFVVISVDRPKRKKVIANKEEPTEFQPKFYCRYCGAQNKSDAVFCEKCGKKLKET